jgi:hypothetical protein
MDKPRWVRPLDRGFFMAILTGAADRALRASTAEMMQDPAFMEMAILANESPASQARPDLGLLPDPAGR